MNDLKKVLLAGIGLTAMTVDKADSFVKELVSLLKSFGITIAA